MKTRLSVIICVQVGEIINGMTQNGLIVFHFRQIQKLDRLKKTVEWSQHQRLEDETVKGNIPTTEVLFGKKEKRKYSCAKRQNTNS